MRSIKSLPALGLLCFFVAILAFGCSHDSHHQTADASSPATLSHIQLPTSAQEIETLRQLATAAWEEDIATMLAQEQPTFDNSVHALNDALYSLDKTKNIFSTAYYLSPAQEVRDAAAEAESSLSSVRRQVYLNTQLYQALQFVAQNAESLDRTDTALLRKLMQDFEQQGIALDENDTALFKDINDEIDALEKEFQGNVTNAQNTVVFTPEQLQGLPDSALALLQRTAGGDYIFDARLYSPYAAILTYAQDEATRQQTYVTYNSVAKEHNPAILERLVQLRAQKAELLGYATYADLKLAPRMAENTATAMDFLDRIHTGIEAKLASEKNLLLELKRNHTADPDAQFYVWDINFYINRYSKEQFDLDHSAMQKYFSLERCLQGMFDTFAAVFNIEIIPYDNADIELWHSDVRCYEIRASAGGASLGLFYLDPYPREGKYTWYASMFTYAGNRYRDGSGALPSGILMGNWNKPTPEEPSLLTFFDLRVLFHEFGHILHRILLDTTYAELHFSSFDFVEVPSQMLERWCYDQRVLERFAVNYQNELDVLPSDYVSKIRQAENAFSALTSASSILARSMTDLTLHSAYAPEDPVDVDAVSKEMFARYSIPHPQEASSIARFEHLAGGYEAGVYSYLWSLAIVHDLITRFEQSPEGLLDAEIGAALKQYIYEPGLTRDENDSIEEFLGREWSVDAYLDFLAQ